MFGLTGMMSETVNADVDLQVTSMTTSKYVRDYAMKRCSVFSLVNIYEHVHSYTDFLSTTYPGALFFPILAI